MSAQTRCTPPSNDWPSRHSTCCRPDCRKASLNDSRWGKSECHSFSTSAATESNFFTLLLHLLVGQAPPRDTLAGRPDDRNRTLHTRPPAYHSVQERGLPTRTPTVLRESSRRLQCSLILAGGVSTSSSSAPSIESTSDRIGIDAADRDYPSGSRGERAEVLAQEAVELVPEDPRPWQALAEACDAQGARSRKIDSYELSLLA